MIEDIGADCYFHKGRNDHVACQDYALVGKTEDGEVWAILSDGCSSSPHTDVGARILAWSAREVIEKFPGFNLENYYITTMLGACGVVKQMCLPPNCLDATLLTLRVGKQGGDQPWVTASLYGDGYLAVRYEDGWTRGVQCVYAGIGNGTYPRYLSYSIDKGRAQQRDLVGGPGYAEAFSISPTGELETKEKVPIENHYDYCCPVPEGATSIFIASDGVGQFAKIADKEYRPFHSILQGLTGVKGYAGQFVQRRVAKFLNKECPDLSIVPFDDVSVAAIRLKELNHG